MNPKSLLSVATAAAAVLFNIAFVTPAHAQVKAALTRDVDRSSAQPVNGNCSSSAQPYPRCTLYTVPAGKRLVVETVSYLAAADVGQYMTGIVFGQDAGRGLYVGNPNTFLVTSAFLYQFGSSSVYGGAQALKMYLDENQILGAAIHIQSSETQWFNFSGYLVDK